MRRKGFALDGGRVLYLAEDPAVVRRQLAGEDVRWDADRPLRAEISTDEIIPARHCLLYDDRLGDFPYVGLRCGDESPVEPGSVRAGGFVVSVAGARRGKGSSREHAPYAELCAGIRVVFAASFERIYKQNCINLGIAPSTRMELLARLEAGDEVPVDELLAGEDPATIDIVAAGGLLPWAAARGAVARPADPPAPDGATPRSTARLPLGDRILAAHVDVAARSAGDRHETVSCDLRFSHEYVTPMAASLLEKAVGPGAELAAPASVMLFEDHLALLGEAPNLGDERLARVAEAMTLARRQREFAEAHGVRLHGPMRGASEAICHVAVTERYALPGQVVVGTDSHTTHAGGLGCLAFGVGTTDMVHAFLTGSVRVVPPPSIAIRISGSLPAACTAKDLMLWLLARDDLRGGRAVGTLVHYVGSAVRALSVDERCTLTNMAAEVGGFAGIVGADEHTASFLVERRGMTPADAAAACAAWRDDEAAVYADEIDVDAGAVVPMVALPGDPGRGIPVDDLAGGTPIDIAYGGSCTGAKRADMDMYASVLAAALDDGRRVHDDVEFIVQFGSVDVEDYCRDRGYLGVFERAGVRVVGAGCGACINAGPGASVAGQVVVSSQNRNFPGRSGAGDLYLGSPLTVAASAIAGRIVSSQGA